MIRFSAPQLLNVSAPQRLSSLVSTLQLNSVSTSHHFTAPALHLFNTCQRLILGCIALRCVVLMCSLIYPICCTTCSARITRGHGLYYSTQPGGLHSAVALHINNAVLHMWKREKKKARERKKKKKKKDKNRVLAGLEPGKTL